VITNGIDLEVVEPGHTANFSARLELAGDGVPQVVGFVVEGRGQRHVIVRAVGPTLSSFGIARPAADPGFRLFDSSGREVSQGGAAVDTFRWRDAFAAAGIFPLTGGETSYRDYILDPGAYTIVVMDNRLEGGTALVEIYDFS